MGESAWTVGALLPQFPELVSDIQTKNLIIGGGLCGLLCAYFLDRAGEDYLLVEGGRICGGTTQNTTAKITAQHGLIYDRLLRMFGRQRAAQYLRANQRALEDYRTLAKEIECGFEPADAFAYSRDPELLRRESTALAEIGFEAPVVSDVPLPVAAAGAVKFRNQAQFHPLQFAAGIAQNLRIFENSFVHFAEPGAAFVNGHKISAENIVVATHFPFINTHGLYFMKLYQQRSYVLGLEDAPLPDGMYIDGDGNRIFFPAFWRSSSAWRRRSPDRQERRGIRRAAEICARALSKCKRAICICGAGLYVAGRRALYRAVRPFRQRDICCFRLQ